MIMLSSRKCSTQVTTNNNNANILSFEQEPLNAAHWLYNGEIIDLTSRSVGWEGGFRVGSLLRQPTETNYDNNR